MPHLKKHQVTRCGKTLAKKQKAQTFIRKGNVAYQNGKFQDAELNYRKSLAENSKNTTAKYNIKC